MSASEQQAAGGKILLVEDDPMIRALTTEWVEDAGFEVREVESGGEALECARGEGGFRAAILDLSLPDMGGAALLGELQSLYPGLPVLFATGNPNLLDDFTFEERTTALLRKPYSRADLAASLQDLLGRGA